MEHLWQIAMFVLTSIVGLVGYYFKRNESRLEAKDKELQGQVDLVKKDLSEYKLDAQKEFVSKDEFIRAISNQDKKLDKIYDEVMRLSGKKG